MEVLTMNRLSRFGALVLVIVLASAWGCGSTSTKEGTGDYVDDSVITAKVKTAIYNDPTLKVNEINVETFKGVVQLSGFVKSQAEATQATQVARGVAGVKSVKNDFRIKGGGGRRCVPGRLASWERSWEPR
jgi:hyperosmotically inducible protein